MRISYSGAVLAIVLGLTGQSCASSKRNFAGTFGSSPAPFTINVSTSFLEFTKVKVQLTRFTDDISQPDFADGPPRQNATAVASYWANEYDWESAQEGLNAQYKQFTTTVNGAGENSTYTEPIPLHFVHHTSSRADAIPLLFVHGFPGSFMEVGNIISALTNPENDSVPAFHVVAPSLPGFGFSPAPTVPGLGFIATAHAFDALMKQLNYTQYVLQGGDLGGIITRYLAHYHPESVVSLLSNFWVVQPTAADLASYTAGHSSSDITYMLGGYEAFTHEGFGYAQIQQTRPLRLAVGLTDSPIGLAMWIYDSMYGSVPNPGYWSAEDVITWTMMYWIQGPYASFRFYKEGATDGGINLDGIGLIPYVSQPVAISEFPYDIWYLTPLDWAQRSGNVKYRTVHTSGGHFAATTTPELLIADIQAFFGNRSISGTGVFN